VLTTNQLRSAGAITSVILHKTLVMEAHYAR
jgi:hypothetical protein